MSPIHDLVRRLDTLFNGRPDAPIHYRKLRRNIIVTMLGVTIIPLTAMGVLNHYQYGKHLRNEMKTPLANSVQKARHSFDLYLEERLSAMRFIANAYDYDTIRKPETLHRLLGILKSELGGFVDLAVLDTRGAMVGYEGPYNLKEKNYASQHAFQEVLVKGSYISPVFLGHRKFPHIVMAVQRYAEHDANWIIRATLDTDRFYRLLESLDLSHESDAFLVNAANILQTDSRFYGTTLAASRLEIPKGNRHVFVREQHDPDGREILVAGSRFTNADYILVITQPRSEVLRSWYSLKADALLVYGGSLMVILFVVVKMSGAIVSRVRVSDRNREVALTELQHTQKLSSIGRLAAGVAHEINNPLAIINEKAGLVVDLLALEDDFGCKTRLVDLNGDITASVDRCKAITHRLLGFARKLDTSMEPIAINALLKDVMGFLEREALYRQIDLSTSLAEGLPEIVSDRGQLQQVFLNLLTNAFAAVEDGGFVSITSRPHENGGIRILMEDDGCGMNEKTARHIFDPFFSTRKGSGTGLGLSITYGILQKLGGHIHLSTQEGRGTVFTITLPKTAPPEPDKETAP